MSLAIMEEDPSNTPGPSKLSLNGKIFGATTATVSITNEKPLDLSFLNFSSPVEEIFPPSTSSSSSTSRINGESHGSKPMQNGAGNKKNGKVKPTQRPETSRSNGTRKRVLNSTAAIDKRPKTSQNLKNELHGNIHYFASEPNHRYVTQDGDEFSGQFRCTSLNCNKVLSNNISFMYHLWAHVGFFQRRVFSNASEEMTDEKFTRLCSVCLRMFETACEKTKHYLEVHRGIHVANRLCHMCEIVDHDGTHFTQIKHRINELPFECKRCKFRSSSRLALIDHFSKSHIGTALLICPFCPYTTQITASEKLKPIVLAKNYVNHVTDHGDIISKKCSCCSYKFIDDEQFKKHTKCHQNEQHKWPIQTKTFKVLKDEMLVTKPRPANLSLMKCLECFTIYSKTDEHLGKTRTCSRCSFSTTCANTYWAHKNLSDCDPENKKRFELAVTKDDKWKRPKCSKKFRKQLHVVTSADFIQNFRLFRDFTYDRKPSIMPISSTKSASEIVKERRERLRKMTTARKTNDILPSILDDIANSLFGEHDDETDTINFVKQIRVPQIPLYEEFLETLRTREKNEIEKPIEASDKEVQETETFILVSA